MQLRPYQDRCVRALLRNDSAIVKSPAGSGKTIIAAAALKEKGDWPTLWIANTIDQCSQARKACDQFGLKNVTIRCVSPALIRYLEQGINDDILVVDECHHATAELWAQVVNYFAGAVVWGFSATPFKDPDHEAQMLVLFGGMSCNLEIITVSREEVQKYKGITRGKVVFVKYDSPDFETACSQDIREDLKKVQKKYAWMRNRSKWRTFQPERYQYPLKQFAEQAKRIANKYPNIETATLAPYEQRVLQGCWKDIIDMAAKRLSYQWLLDHAITNYLYRNDIVVELAAMHDEDSVIILVNTVEHGEGLLEMIPGAVFCHGRLTKKRREAMIEGFRNGAHKVLIATSLADEGLDVPRANILILACAGKAAHKLEQRTGRVLRSFEQKEHGIIYDFYDTCHYMLKSQSSKREAVYKRLKYEIEYVQYEDFIN